jgi:hypothetical protein
MSDSIKKYYEMIADGEITPIKKHTILTYDVAREEWEEYWKHNYNVLQNSEDFEVAYGFVHWLKNKKLIN